METHTTNLDLENATTPLDLVQSISRLIRNHEGTPSFSTFSVTVYDTAWVSMVRRVVHDDWHWLFPQCFDYVLSQQQDDGTWPCYASQIDGILNSLAALLALLTHQKLDRSENLQLSTCIKRAEIGIQRLLGCWDVHQTVHVGYEILVPSLLSQVRQFGMAFNFPGLPLLMKLNKQKYQKFRLDLVYSKSQTTLLHSLEALVGLIDFDKVEHHCTTHSGIFGSPASTAAYILNRSEWDEKAELYLKRVVHCSGNSAVPSAFPTAVFEIAWVRMSQPRRWTAL